MEVLLLMLFAIPVFLYLFSKLYHTASVDGAVVVVCNSFTEKWPAIDDDEFVRRCAPGTSRNTALKVRRIISKQLGIPYEHIYPEQSFVEDLDC